MGVKETYGSGGFLTQIESIWRSVIFGWMSYEIPGPWWRFSK